MHVFYCHDIRNFPQDTDISDMPGNYSSDICMMLHPLSCNQDYMNDSRYIDILNFQRQKHS